MWASGSNPARLSLYTHLINYDVEGYELNQFARLLAPLKITPDVSTIVGILKSQSVRLSEEQVDYALPVSDSGPLVAICPGSSNRYKHWDATKFAAVIQALVARNCRVAIIGGTAETTQAERIAHLAASSRVTNYTAKLSLTQTAAVLLSTRLFIGCDSGIAHLAAALGKPTVVLFGTSDDRSGACRIPTTSSSESSFPADHAPCSGIINDAGISPAWRSRRGRRADGR